MENKIKTLSDCVFKNKMIMEKEGYYFISFADVERKIRDMKEEIEEIQEDFARLEICNKEEVINIINKHMGKELI